MRGGGERRREERRGGKRRDQKELQGSDWGRRKGRRNSKGVVVGVKGIPMQREGEGMRVKGREEGEVMVMCKGVLQGEKDDLVSLGKEESQSLL